MNLTANQTENQKRNFQQNFRRELLRTGLTLAELSNRTGVDLQTLRRWRREGVAQPEHDHIERIAEVFGIADPWSLMRCGGSGYAAPIDRETNSEVENVRKARPEIFTEFEPDDWAELYSQHGTGGPLTAEGVVQAAHKINEKREIRRKFEAILETHHFRTLASLIEVLYRDTDLHGLDSSK
jgi:transcriptional regulator with XRE-family HTH domain